jgi:hypothetical protein
MTMNKDDAEKSTARAELQAAAGLVREALRIGELSASDVITFKEDLAGWAIAHEIDFGISIERAMRLLCDTPKSEIAAEVKAMHAMHGTTATVNACRAMRDFAVGLTHGVT